MKHKVDFWRAMFCVAAFVALAFALCPTW